MPVQNGKNGFRTFVVLWMSQSVSVFGSALAFFSITLWLTQVLYPRTDQKPELAFALTAVSLAFALPQLVAAPLAGAWADRHDRRKIMVTMDILSGVLTLGLGILVAANALNLWLLMAFMALLSIAGAFHFSAFDTSYAMLVPPAQLPRANGMMQSIFSLSNILSPSIAAVLVSIPVLARKGGLGGPLSQMLSGLSDGTPLAIGIDSLTFFGAAVVALFLEIPSPKREELPLSAGTRNSLLADIKTGALYIWHRRPMLWLLGTFAVCNLLMAPLGIFQPLIVKFALAGDWQAKGLTYETAMALIGTIAGIGGLFGGLLISAWGGLKRRRVLGVVGPMVLSGVALGVFGLSPWVFLSAGAMFFINGFLPVMNAHSQAIWQTQTPHELQGRVFAVRRLIAQFLGPAGTALGGWAAGVFDPGAALAVLGIVLSVFCMAQLLNPQLLHVENKALLDRMADAAASSGIPTP